MTQAKDNKKPTSIVTVDNYGKKSYLLKSDALTPLNKLRYRSSHFYVTYLANKDIIIAPIEVSASIDGSDLEGLIEDRAYEELGLDPAQEYIVRYQEIEGREDQQRTFQLFVIERNKYEEIFAALRKQIKYIDLIVPAPLLYGSLYDMDILTPKGVHTFLYFAHNDTFVTFYKDGKYLYSKSIPFSFDQIYHRYCEMVGDTVDEGRFFKTLRKEGLKTLKSDFQQNLMKLFGEIFISINDIIIYTKRAYDLEIIDQMFIGSEMGAVAGLDEYVQNYLGFHSTPLEFNFDLRTDEWHTDQMQYMMAACALSYIHQPDGKINFTLYPKPPTFFKRPSGQIAALMLIALMVAMALPIYHYVSASLNDIQTYKYKQEERHLALEVARYKKLLKQKKSQYEQAGKIIEDLSTHFSSKEKTLKTIYGKKVNYRLKSDQLVSMGEDLIESDVKTDNIESNMDNYSISLIASDNKKITELIKKISKKYYDDIEMIDIKTIEKEDNTTMYRGILKVRLR